MITRNHSLWTRLQSFEFDTGSPALTFAQRLAQEQRWTPAFALRVLEEYRRFLFLACTLKHPVTPSKHVDEAWHLHLTYTRSYWERLCPQVLQRALHHDPTRGGAAESAKFVDWYQRTLEAYRDAFEQEPPSDIWPSSKARPAPPLLAPPGGTPERAGAVAETSGVPPVSPARNDADYWIIRKPSRERALTSVACGLGVMLIGGCTPLVLGTGNSSFPVLLILGLFAVTGLLLLLMATYRKHGGRDSTGQTGGGGGCSTYVDSSGTHTGGGHNGHGCGHGCDGGSHGGSDGGGTGDGGGGGGGSDGGGSGCGGGGCGGGCGGGD